MCGHVYVCLWLAGFAYVWRRQQGCSVRSYTGCDPGRKLRYEGNWTPSPGRRTGLDTPAIQSSIKVKETLKLHENVSEGFLRDSE